MARPIILGIVGDSAAGKTTITRGLVRVLGEDQVTHVCTDDYHRYDRRQRAERNITPLDPECNHLDILAQHLGHLRASEPIMKPVYQHTDGTFGPPVHIEPERFVVAEGLLGFYTDGARRIFDVRVYLDPPEELRRNWKVQRDCSRRGYTTDQVLSELDRREPDSERSSAPSAATPTSSSPSSPARPRPGAPRLQAHAPVDRCSIPTSRVVDRRQRRGRDPLIERDGELAALRPRPDQPRRAAAIEEAIWGGCTSPATCARSGSGEFTIGTDLHRSDSLAVVQLLILYHLFTARASVALGGNGTRVPERSRRRSSTACKVSPYTCPGSARDRHSCSAARRRLRRRAAWTLVAGAAIAALSPGRRSPLPAASPTRPPQASISAMARWSLDSAPARLPRGPRSRSSCSPR